VKVTVLVHESQALQYLKWIRFFFKVLKLKKENHQQLGTADIFSRDYLRAQNEGNPVYINVKGAIQIIRDTFLADSRPSLLPCDIL